MNRSILVVMCDFIVLSMLSMITGLTSLENPYGEDGTVVDGRAASVIVETLRREQSRLRTARAELEEAQEKLGFSAARAEAIRQIALKIEETDLRLELLQKGSLDGRRKLLPEELPRKVDLELKTHAKLRTQYRNAMRQLEDMQQRYDVAQTKFRDLNRQKGVSGSALRASSAELVATREELAKQESALLLARSELAESVDKLRSLNGELEKYQSKLEDYEERLAEAGNKLENVGSELNDTRKKLLQSESEAAGKARELEAVKRQVASVRSVLKRAVKDLADERSRSEFRSEQLQRARSELRAARSEADEVASRLVADVLTKYSLCCVTYDFHIREDRFFLDRETSGGYFLPAVTINNRSFVVGNFWLLSGLAGFDEAPEDVSELDISIAPALQTGAAGRAEKLPGPLYVLNADCRMALLEAPSTRSRATQALDYGALRKRGVHELYLFKPYSFGRDSAPLEKRCALSMAEDDPYLYIRNSGEPTEVAAAPGDFVMTRDGLFVGVVVRLDRRGRQFEAKCMVLPENFGVGRNSVKIDFARSPNAEKPYFDNFASGAGRVMLRIKNLEKAHR